jgi:DNA damage-binding protein 1
VRNPTKAHAHQISSPTTLSYLDNQILYVGSHYGDAQIIRLHETPFRSAPLPVPSDIRTSLLSNITLKPKGKARANPDVTDDGDDNDHRDKGKVIKAEGSYVEVLEQFSNIAPIVDATLVDPENSGQPQVVTCSGGQNTGALKVVRKGADFEELVILDGLANVTNIFPLKESLRST